MRTVSGTLLPSSGSVSSRHRRHANRRSRSWHKSCSHLTVRASQKHSDASQSGKQSQPSSKKRNLIKSLQLSSVVAGLSGLSLTTLTGEDL